MVDLCERCELPLDQCPHGRGISTRRGQALDLVADGPTINATQWSTCAGCGRTIEPGSPITHTEEGWAHADEVQPKEAVVPRDNYADFGGIE